MYQHLKLLCALLSWVSFGGHKTLLSAQVTLVERPASELYSPQSWRRVKELDNGRPYGGLYELPMAKVDTDSPRFTRIHSLKIKAEEDSFPFTRSNSFKLNEVVPRRFTRTNSLRLRGEVDSVRFARTNSFRVKENTLDLAQFLRPIFLKESQGIDYTLDFLPKDIVPDLDQIETIAAFRQANLRYVFLDYDGTLVNLVNNPDDALPTDRLIRILEALDADHENTVVAIISGRDKVFLGNQFDRYKSFTVCAEHGMFVRHPGKNWEAPSEPLDLSWKPQIMQIMQEFERNFPGSRIENKETSLVWHYVEARIQPSPETVQSYVSRLKGLVTKAKLDARPGSNIIEVTVSGYDKGEMLIKLLKRNPENPNFILCMGDDTTDENMFGRLLLHERDVLKSKPSVVKTVIVNKDVNRKTYAKFAIKDVETNLGFLEKMVGLNEL